MVIDPFLWIFFAKFLVLQALFLLIFPFVDRFISVSSIHENSWKFFSFSFYSDDWMVGQWLVLKSRFSVWLLLLVQSDMGWYLKKKRTKQKINIFVSMKSLMKQFWFEIKMICDKKQHEQWTNRQNDDLNVFFIWNLLFSLIHKSAAGNKNVTL